MGSQEKSERMQGTWLQHILRGRYPNRRPGKKTKEYIANYFEQLYQAGEGTALYAEWTNKIKNHIRKKQNKKNGTLPLKWMTK